MSDWVFRADTEAVFDALRDGTHGASLREYFGVAGHAELTRLAAAGARKPRRGPPVWILPGIMGSRLAARARGATAPKVLWIDPRAIGAGALQDLVLPAPGPGLQPLGVLLFAYARLVLQLRSEGFDTRLHAYDWRLGIDVSGAALAAAIRAARRPVVLIGHSMGGLIARMAMRRVARRSVSKLIMLGTPNFGSYGPVQALRGTYPFVRKVALLDLQHSPEYLAERVFSTFPGLYQLLPPRRRLAGADLYAPDAWPTEGPQPDPRLLARVAGVRAQLAPPDARMLQIVGVNRKTVVAVRRGGSGFDYEFEPAGGDGSVPLRLARLPGIRTYYVDEAHANLANNAAVIAAIGDLLRGGRTQRLAMRWRPPCGAALCIDDAGLAANDGAKIDWSRLDAAGRAATLAHLGE
jgi:pimeloyl-ACP methyl ester carboxylesterase